jgi:hypothetical protein
LQVGIVDGSDRAQLKSVILGHDYGNEVEVVSGLADSDAVIVNPPDSLLPGEKFRVVEAQSNGESAPIGTDEKSEN